MGGDEQRSGDAGKADRAGWRQTRTYYYNPTQWLVLKPSAKAKRWTDNYASVLPHLSFWEIFQMITHRPNDPA